MKKKVQAYSEMCRVNRIDYPEEILEAFADDINAEFQSDAHINRWLRWKNKTKLWEEFGLEINTHKSKILTLQKEPGIIEGIQKV